LGPDGSVTAWGDNSFGQTSVPSSATSVVAIAAGGVHSLALRADGTVILWGGDGPTSVPTSATNVVAIAAGRSHSLVLRADGTVVQWGGDAIPPAAATNVVAIAAGANHDLALRADGSVLAWGANYFGQATVPPGVTNVIGIAAGGDHSLALLADGTLIAWGDDAFGQSDVPVQSTNTVSFVAGYAHNLALTASGGQLATRAATLGDFIQLNALRLHGVFSHYQWQLNGIDIAGATNATLVVGNIGWTNTGTYRVTLSNALGTVVGPPTTLSVLRTPLRFDTSVSGLQGGSFRLRLLGASGVGRLVVYASSNLVDWVPFFDNPPVTGTLDVLDLWSAGTPQRFYRAVEETSMGPLNLGFVTSAKPAVTGALSIRVTGLTALGPVTIYASSNLVNWDPIFTNPPTIGPLQYQERPLKDQAQRFYRASEAR
jgi:hypothetical protein